jgi:hypothetical protein
METVCFSETLVSTYESSALKMEAKCFSETVVYTYESTRRHNPEQHRHPHGRENLKSHENALAWSPNPVWSMLFAMAPVLQLSFSLGNYYRQGYKLRSQKSLCIVYDELGNTLYCSHIVENVCGAGLWSALFDIVCEWHSGLESVWKVTKYFMIKEFL